MSDNMNEKYQQYYNKVLTGTLTDTLMKSISYQANIQLANEIIAEQEKLIVDLKSNADNLKKEIETIQADKTVGINTEISNLKNTIKVNSTTITKLQTELYEASKLKNEYENVKHQVQHLDTYRNQVVKANDTIKVLTQEKETLQKNAEEKIKALTDEINLLKTPKAPVKKAKVAKQTVNVEVTKPKAKIIKQDLPGLIVKDGGNF